jgi:hypothetical protein
MSNQADANNAALYALNWTEREVTLPFNKGSVTYVFRRAKNEVWIGNEPVNEAARFYEMSKSETIIKRGGVREDHGDSSEALAWLWDRLALRAFITKEDGTNNDIELTPETRKAIKPIHKELGVNATCAYRCEVLEDRTEETLSGGNYYVRVYHGSAKAEALVGVLCFTFWDENTRRKHKNSIIQRSERRGTDLVSTIDPAIFPMAAMFDSLVQSIEGAGISDGENVRPATVEDLRKNADFFLKVDVMAALITHWEDRTGK